MEDFGYEKGKEKDTLLTLQEATLLVSLDEFDDLISFLQYAKERHIYQKEHYESNGDHTHYKDWKTPRDNNALDFIIATNFDERVDSND